MPKRNMSREKRSETISSPAAMNITCSISCASVLPSSRSRMQSPSTAAASSGNIVDATSVIRADDGKEYEVLGMGPIAVLPEYQRRGIGRRMIGYTRNRAREMGFRAIFLYGDPDYSSHCGFVPAETLGIRTADNRYAAALQVCALQRGSLSGLKGRYVEAAVYHMDEKRAAEFDRHFPVRKSFPVLRLKNVSSKLPPCGENRIRPPAPGNPVPSGGHESRMRMSNSSSLDIKNKSCSARTALIRRFFAIRKLKPCGGASSARPVPAGPGKPWLVPAPFPLGFP